MLYHHYFLLSFRICNQDDERKQKGMELNGTHHLLLYADINLLGKNISIIKKSIEAIYIGC
jgi:hypothetical protein